MTVDQNLLHRTVHNMLYVISSLAGDFIVVYWEYKKKMFLVAIKSSPKLN